ncbi:MAG: hypothetical protein HND52_07420 [Ignavibacteriae bacterium]|nr:hypothetical protein [Ignavibacteriota bacterium]NOG97774.1 hypothetical protein [Ignavibacteriota bacterium]
MPETLEKNKSKIKIEKNGNDSLNRLVNVLSSDLDFHNLKSNHGSHNFHSFPAKFPPQLPSKFILELTEQNDLVLDPMAGSGTTIVESLINKRNAIGFDIDPLALMITEVKTSFFNKKILIDTFSKIISHSIESIQNRQYLLDSFFEQVDENTKKFVHYWFSDDTIAELVSLLNPISKIKDKNIRTFFEVIFSSIIITKSGGVSLAMDLAHTRPHRVKKAVNFNSELLFDLTDTKVNSRHHILSKKLKSPILEFKKKFYQNIKALLEEKFHNQLRLEFADSQYLPLPDNSVDLIVTSPPYASNAIDYMRAHKFSLLWFGYSIDDLKDKRTKYIGGDATSNFKFEEMPQLTEKVLKKLAEQNSKKSLVLHRYYSEMTHSLREMFRVLKSNKSAIVVVGNSVLSGVPSETHLCLKEIGEQIGFTVPHIGVRKLDRNRRMLPASNNSSNSQILQRMTEEYIIGFYKK